MKRIVAGLIGTVALLAATLLAVARVDGSPENPVFVTVVTLLAIVALVGVLVKVAGGNGDDDAAAVPWAEAGALVEDAPERSPAEYDISGQELAEVVESAGEASRDDGTVEAGIEVVRPALREALLAAMVQSGIDRTAAERSLARGDWTDDATAAAVLDESIDHPGWGLLQRIEAWLFPERIVRREVQQAMQAVAKTADELLPTVPGQHAPRTVPVVRPTLEDLRRGADGHLQRAADPLGARTGSSVDASMTVHDAESLDDDLAAGDDATDDDATGGDATDDEGTDEEATDQHAIGNPVTGDWDAGEVSEQ